MKWLVFFILAAQVFVINARVLSKRLPKFCAPAVPNYNECNTQTLRKLGPHLLKGVREINFPKLNPLQIPLWIINRTVSDSVSLNAVLKNVVMTGFHTAELKHFKFDSESKHGELHIHVPYLANTLDYEVSGRLLTINIESSGFSKANSTDIPLFFKFSLKPVERLGVTYYALDDFVAKSSLGSSRIQLVSKDPNTQFSANLMQDFVNEDPKRSFEAIQPIYEETVQVLWRKIAEDVLSAIPANELIPN